MKQPSSSIATTPVLPRGHATRVDRELLQTMLDETIDLAEILLRGPRDPESHKHTGMTALQLVDRCKTGSAPDGRGDHSAGFDAPDKTRDVLDRDGKPIEPDTEPPSPVSDPTGNAALALLSGARDRDRVAVVQLARNVDQALDLLRSAVRALNRSQPPGAPVGTGERACTSHARLGHFVAVDPSVPGTELCLWCYRWRNNYGKVPPLPVLEARIAGNRITPKMLKRLNIPA